MQNQVKKYWRILLIIAVVMLVIGLGCAIYVCDYYPADDVAMDCIEKPTEDIKVTEETNERIVFEPEAATVGFIFYPGGKVQYEAYAPLMEKLAERGVLCVLLHMPANLAVLDMNAADGVREEFPNITEWYIGGHSLGGSMAASYLGKHAEDYEGLILLASYSTEDLKETDLDVLSIYGENDKVLNAEKYKENKDNLPGDFEEIIIEGGNHAYFGSYGAQDGDGEPEISNEEQIEFTVDAIKKMLAN